MLGAGDFLFKFVFKSASKFIWLAWVPFKRLFRALAHIFSAGHFLIKVVFKSVPKLICWALVRSKLHFRGLARVLGAGYFLFTLVFETCTETDLAGLGLSQAPFSRFRSRAWRQ